MLRSMYSGISGLKNFQTKLDVIGNNIANVNTYGFKKSRVTFKDMISQQIQGASSPQLNRGGTNPKQVGLGSQVATIDQIHTQGSLQTTGRSLDLGISGDGFFIVNDGQLSYYTRAGNFYLDSNGYLVNADGLYVQGYAADAAGVIDYSQLSNLRIAAGSIIAPTATNNITFKGNLHANTEIADATNGRLFTPGATIDEQTLKEGLKSGASLTMKVVDSLGNRHDLQIVLQKISNTEWQAGYLLPAGSGEYTFESLGNITFNTEGSAVGNPTFTINLQPQQLTPGYTGNAEPLNITVEFGNVTQYGSLSTIDVDTINGNTEGFLEGFNVSSAGEIFGVYSNGQVQLLGQIALANFNNPEGLTKVGENLYQVSNNSGVPNVGIAGQDMGTINGGTLEMSNVDLSEEFTEMIVAQRGFQANTRIITTSDEILQELVNLKR